MNNSTLSKLLTNNQLVCIKTIHTQPSTVLVYDEVLECTALITYRFNKGFYSLDSYIPNV